MTTLSPEWIWIALGAAALIVVAIVVASSARRRRSNQLRSEFGSEYRHTVAETGSKSRAERELRERKERVRDLEIRPLSAADRDEAEREWKRIEARFIERPTTAVVEADELIAEVMRKRGYPAGDFNQNVAELSVHYPRVTSDYRSAHEVLTSGKSSTEQLRQALLRYRAIFSELAGETIGVTTASEEVRRGRRPSDERPEDRERVR